MLEYQPKNEICDDLSIAGFPMCQGFPAARLDDFPLILMEVGSQFLEIGDQ
jgi:hypothetical protein